MGHIDGAKLIPLGQLNSVSMKYHATERSSVFAPPESQCVGGAYFESCGAYRLQHAKRNDRLADGKIARQQRLVIDKFWEVYPKKICACIMLKESHSGWISTLSAVRAFSSIRAIKLKTTISMTDNTIAMPRLLSNPGKWPRAWSGFFLQGWPAKQDRSSKFAQGTCPGQD